MHILNAMVICQDLQRRVNLPYSLLHFVIFSVVLWTQHTLANKPNVRYKSPIDPKRVAIRHKQNVLCGVRCDDVSSEMKRKRKEKKKQIISEAS